MVYKKKVVIGVGGNIGSGKTTVSRIFHELGAYYISADQIGRDLLPEISQDLKKEFGDHVFEDGELCREKLRQIVFREHDKLKILNALSHPLLIRKIKDVIERTDSEIFVIDAALLFDWSEIYKIVDYPVLVVSDDDKKQERAQTKGIGKQLFQQILECQKTEKEMSTMAKYIIENNSSLEELQAQCHSIYKEIKNGY